jgi:hypothetical protein
LLFLVVDAALKRRSSTALPSPVLPSTVLPSPVLPF